jgi:flagellar motor switch protein FliM
VPNEAEPSTAKTYDFRRPEALDRHQLRILPGLIDLFTRSAAQELAGGLRCRVSLRAGAVTQSPADAVCTELPAPAAPISTTLSPLPGRALLHLPLPTAFALIDLRLGGSGTGAFPERPLTDIERGLLESLLAPIFASLAATLGRDVTVGALNQPITGQIPELGAAADGFVVIPMDLEISGLGAGEALSGSLTLALAVALLRPVVDALLEQTDQASLPGIVAAAEARMLAADLPIALRFPPVSFPSSRLLALKVGDVLPLGHEQDAPLHLYVGHRPMLFAAPIQSGRRLAAAIQNSPGSTR